MCFYMLFYKRERLARMSMYHMARVVKMFNEAGHKAQAIVVGDGFEEPAQFEYARSLGIMPYHAKNDPRGLKFRHALQYAISQNTDYICKMDSNNVNSDYYWGECIKIMGGDKVPTFGTRHFTVAHSNPAIKETCVFNTREPFHLCNSGQFYLRYSIENCIDVRSLYAPGQAFNFDGTINKALVKKWGQTIVHHIPGQSPSDCIDLKSDTDIHSYKSYMDKGRKIYPNGPTRLELREQYEEIKLLDSGYFDPSHDKSAAQEASPSA